MLVHHYLSSLLVTGFNAIPPSEPGPPGPYTCLSHLCLITEYRHGGHSVRCSCKDAGMH